MHLSISNFIKGLLTACVFFIAETASAQHDYNNLIFKIDSLVEVGLPKSALKETNALYDLAKKENNAPQMIRSVIYRLKFQTYLQDDALVNIIDTLKADVSRAGYPVKPVLQSLLAEMYWNYYTQNRYKFEGRTLLEKPDADFRNWDLATLTGEITRLYVLSLSDSKREQDTPLGVLDGILQGDKRSRYLRPTLYDLLLHRSFKYFLAEEPAITRPKVPFRVNDKRYFADSKTFAALTINAADTNATLYHGIKFLQQGIAYHLEKHNGKALADLDLQRLEFVYRQSTQPNKGDLYVAALQRVAADTSVGDWAAKALYNIGSYYEESNSLVTALVFLRQAVSGFPKSDGAVDAQALINRIRLKTLNATIEDVNAPGQSILASLTYRNINQARFRIFKLTDAQLALLKKLDNYELKTSPIQKQAGFLKRLKTLQDETLTLPATTDYREHRTEFRVVPLTPGTYVLFLQQATAKDSLTQLSTFKVTALAYSVRTRPDGAKEVRVTNRETGDPVPGASVTFTFEASGTRKIKPAPIHGITNGSGTIIVKTSVNFFQLDIIYNNDRLTVPREYYYGDLQNNLTKDSAITTLLFTDRQLYRPGQTIYFKALQTQLINGKSMIMPKASIVVTLKDRNARAIGNVTLQTNTFGSAASSFIIPQNTINGYFILATSDGQTLINVEEYKRPTFTVAFEPVIKNYKLNDSISIKGTVTAFSGYGLSKSRVGVHVFRNMKFNDLLNGYNRHTADRYISRRQETPSEILTDTIETDDQGHFEIKFRAAGDSPSPEAAYDFKINASATDAAGETQVANTQLDLTNSAIRLNAVIPEKLFSKKGGNAIITVSNAANQRQNGKAVVQIYALKKSRQFFKDRYWEEPDQWLLSKADYERYFPRFAYRHADEYANWPREAQLANRSINLKKDNSGRADLPELLSAPAGMYAVVISAKNAEGDTASVTRYVSVITDGAPLQKNTDWVIAEAATVRSGEPAILYAGIGQNAKVLMETFDGPKLLTSRLLHLGTDSATKIVVPVVKTTKNSFAVQLSTINGNRAFAWYQRILVADTTKPLNIKFLSMRDKLQPGQKEQWRLQVTGSDDLRSAEMLAGMYDASLDEIMQALSWDKNLAYTPYTPNYFAWNVDRLSEPTNTEGDTEYSPDNYYSRNTNIQYEELYLQDFDITHEGDYKYYNESVTAVKKTLNEKRSAAIYKANSALVKNGYDVVGRVLFYNLGVAGARIKIHKTNISTLSNSLGYFRIKVPVNAKLVISAIDRATIKIRPERGLKMTIQMRDRITPQTVRDLEVADPGAKDQKGDPNADIRIDEPVGNADVKQVVEYDNAVYGYNSPQRFPAPVVKRGDDVLKKLVTLREISTKGFNVRSQEKNLLTGGTAPIAIRKNFNETAFFYPQLLTNEKGELTIDFTMPESLTKWKFRGFAHNKSLQTGYIEQEIITQKKMMISANMPRFLREGDSLTVSARVVNLSDGKLKGEARIEFFDALTMQPVNLFQKPARNVQHFELDTAANKAVSYNILIPEGLEAVTYRVTASAGNYTDGEENTLPVLPNHMLVTETMPITVRPGQTKNYKFDKLLNQNSSTLINKSLTVEYTQNPAWTVVAALPYLMEFPYECSEQIFSRFYANRFATGIIGKYPQIKQVFDRWKGADTKSMLSALESNPELKSVLLEETPWLQDAEKEADQRKRIALLFDLNKITYELNDNLDKLQKKQLSNGGFPWFGGNFADRYISQHILAGIGQLNKLKLTDNSAKLSQISTAALAYADQNLINDEADQKKFDKKYRTRNLDATEIHAWYARSYFNDVKITAELKEVRDNYVNRAVAQWTNQPEFEKGMMALTLFRLGQKENAAMIIKSLLETARQSDELGMYWPANQWGYYWNQSPVETQTLMIELFTEAGNRPNEVEEMKIWLLRNKQANNWRTTKATAAACYALLANGSNLLTDTAKVAIKLDSKPLAELKPDTKAEAGTGYLKATWANADVKPSYGHVEVSNTGKTVNWGAMYWQYTEKLDKISPSNTNVKMNRKYYIQRKTERGPVLIAVDGSHRPKTGDLLKVVINLSADRDFDYIHLKDMRPAGTEPVEAILAYKQQDGLYYYQVTRDVATNFFISRLNKGTYVFEYQLRVVQPGNYSSGVTTVQSMYAPEFNAHSDGGRLNFEK